MEPLLTLKGDRSRLHAVIRFDSYDATVTSRIGFSTSPIRCNP